jgi:hypothetical protein
MTYSILTAQLQLLLQNISDVTTINIQEDRIEIMVNHDLLSNAGYLCMVVSEETIEKTDLDLADLPRYNGDIQVEISDTKVVLTWHSCFFHGKPGSSYCNTPKRCCHIIPIKERTITGFCDAVNEMAEYHESLRNNPKFQEFAIAIINKK